MYLTELLAKHVYDKNNKKYGKIKFVYDKRCRVITSYSSFKESSLTKAMWNRLKSYGIFRLFYKVDHYEDAKDNFLKSK